MPALLAAASGSATSAHVSLVSVFLRLVFSLGIVLAVIWVLAQYVKRRGVPGTSRSPLGKVRAPGPTIEVLARQPLGKGIALVAVRTGSTSLLLGVTPNQVTMLGAIDPDELEAIDASTRPVERVTLFGIDGQATAGAAQAGAAQAGAGQGGVTQGGVASAFLRPVRIPHPPAPGGSRLDQLRELTTRRS